MELESGDPSAPILLYTNSHLVTVAFDDRFEPFSCYIQVQAQELNELDENLIQRIPSICVCVVCGCAIS